jgi:ABC-2 type transport system permease protein
VSAAWLHIARKELRDILRERTVLVALAVQLMVAGLSTILAVGLTALLDPASLPAEAQADVAYVGNGGFDAYLRLEPGLRVRSMELEDAVAARERGDVDAVVEETPPQGDGPRTVRVLVTEGSLQATILVPTLRALLEAYQLDLRQAAAEEGKLETPVLAVPPGGGGSVSYGFVHGALVPILLLTPAFLSGAIGGDAWVRETQTGTLQLLRSSPVGVASIVGGKLLVPLLLAPAQAGLWLAVLQLGGADIRHEGLLLLACLLLATYLAGLGVAVAATVRRTASSQTLYALLVLLTTGASLWLPRDLFNLLAVVSAGKLPADAVATLAILAAAAALALAAGTAVAVRAVRRSE